MADLTDPSTELANLDAENEKRLQNLMRQGVQFPPMLFEMIKFEEFLKVLLGERLLEAQLAFAQRASDLLDKMFEAVRMQHLTQGVAKPDAEILKMMRPNGG